MATEVRGEARRQSTPLTRGLTLAAAVLSDAAAGILLGGRPPGLGTRRHGHCLLFGGHFRLQLVSAAQPVSKPDGGICPGVRTNLTCHLFGTVPVTRHDVANSQPA